MPRKRQKQKQAKEKGINPKYYFVLCTGGVIKSIKELALALDYLSDEEFRHHVNNERNDFSNWIRDVLKEDELAKQISAVQDKKYIQLIILKHLVQKEVK